MLTRSSICMFRPLCANLPSNFIWRFTIVHFLLLNIHFICDREENSNNWQIRNINCRMRLIIEMTTISEDIRYHELFYQYGNIFFKKWRHIAKMVRNQCNLIDTFMIDKTQLNWSSNVVFVWVLISCSNVVES